MFPDRAALPLSAFLSLPPAPQGEDQSGQAGGQKVSSDNGQFPPANNDKDAWDRPKSRKGRDGRRNQNKTGGKKTTAGGSGNNDLTRLHRLTKRFQNMAGKFRQLVQKKHSPMSQGNFPGIGWLPPPIRPTREIV